MSCGRQGRRQAALMLLALTVVAAVGVAALVLAPPARGAAPAGDGAAAPRPTAVGQPAPEAVDGDQVTFLVLTTAPVRRTGGAGRAVTRADRPAVVARLLADGRRRLAPLDRPLAALLAAGHVTAVERFPAVGVVAVTGDKVAVRTLAALSEVAQLLPDRVHRLPPWGVRAAAVLPSEITWNLELVRAPQVWRRLGATGQGVVVATIDTGVDWTHPALRHSYRGRDGDHAYDWFDVTGPGPGWPRPVDPHGHGTHITGLIVGRDGPVTYGVAPGAEWIAVRAFNEQGIARDTELLRAGQWVLAPTDLQGTHPRPELAPDVVNCSWTLDNAADPLFEPLIDAWRAAGIVPVFAAGNDDDQTGTWAQIRAPASDPDALGVGAVDRTGKVWSLSRGGPGFYGGVKPDLVAPGVDITSVLPGGGVGSYDGTSMAAPHVSGAAALLLGLAPHLTVADVVSFLHHGALDGGPPGPDDRYGWGRLNAEAAALAAFTAGRLAGRVIGPDGRPASGATVEALRTGDQRPWQGRTGPAGDYDFAVPTGTWQVTARAFGAAPARAMATVADDITTRLDLVLSPLATVTVTGRVSSTTGVALAGARVGVVDTSIQTQADARGNYTLSLPPGQHILRAAAAGHRALTTTVSVKAQRPVSQDFILEPAPRLLVVDADAYDEERIAAFLAPALEQAGYPFQVLSISDPATLPSATELADYEVVIWSHLYGSPGSVNRRRGDQAATGALTAYLAGGGRLLLSGQDVGWRDAAEGPLSLRWAPEFYRQILGAHLVAGRAAGPVAGRGPLAGVQLQLDWPRAYVKGPRLSPDVVASASEAAQVVLSYPDGRAAGLAVSDQLGRRMYVAFGLESAGPRRALARLLHLALSWLQPPNLTLETDRMALSPGQAAAVRIGVWVGASGTPLVVQAAAAPGLELQPAGERLAKRPDGRLEWSGTLRGGQHSFRFGARLLAGTPGGRLPITATVRAQGRVVTATATVEALTPNLTPSALQVAPRRVLGGGRVTVTLTLANRGPATASAGADLSLPTAFEPLSDTLRATAGRVSWGPGSGRAQWIGQLIPGQAVQVRLAGRLPPGRGVQHLFSATIVDDSGGVLTRHAAVLVGGPDLAASSLRPSKTTVQAGEVATLTLTVANRGLLEANASAEAELPSDVRWLAAPHLVVSADGRRVSWSGSVAPGAEVTVPLGLQVAPQARGRRSLAVVLGDGYVPDAPLVLPVELDVRRAVLDGSLAAFWPRHARSGQVVTATVLVGNHGDVATRVTVADSLPSALVPDPVSVRHTAGQVQLTPGLVRWVVDVAPSGAYTWTSATRSLPGGGVPIDAPEVDGGWGPIDLGLVFPFGTAAFTQAWVTASGLIAFAPPPPGVRPPAGLDRLAEPALAPLWSPDRGWSVRWRRSPDGVTFIWRGDRPPHRFAAVLAPSGEVEYIYGPDVDSTGAVVGLRLPDSTALEVPASAVVPGAALVFSSPAGWERLTYRARLGMALGPNSRLSRTVQLQAGGLVHLLTAQLEANRLSLEGSRLEVEPATPVAGGLVRGRLVVTAEGEVPARGVEATVELPAGVTLVADSLVGGLVSRRAGRELAWRGRLEPGQEHAMAWAGRLDAELKVGAPLLTRAVVRAAGLAPLQLAAWQKLAATDFSGSAKWAWRPVAHPGQVVGFTLRAVNAGSTPSSVTLTDALPAGLQLVEGTLTASQLPPPQWDPGSRSLRWTGTLPASAAVEVYFQARYLGPGPVTNVMHLEDSAGTVFAAWAEVHPLAARLFLPVVPAVGGS